MHSKTSITPRSLIGLQLSLLVKDKNNKSLIYLSFRTYFTNHVADLRLKL